MTTTTSLKIAAGLLGAALALPFLHAADAPETTANTNTTANTQASPAGLGDITVVGKLQEARRQIVPELGATAYSVSQQQIEQEPQGADAPFNQILLRTPGMAQDSLGQLHLRGEHANLQYRINDILLPEGITGFGAELDPRFVDSLQLITGSLPAQYGFRTAGIVDIQTKSGAFANGGETGMYGGSYDTVRPSVEYGGADGKFNYYFDASYDHNALGIENPTPASTALHDVTDQYRLFSYTSYVLSDTAQISAMAGASYGQFQIPNSPGQPGGAAPDGTPWAPGSFNSASLDENQKEQNYYAIAAYQKSTGDTDFQLAAFGRFSGVHFTPDPAGDLFFNGVAGDVNRRLYSTGLQGDLSSRLNDAHTLRAGMMMLEQVAPTDSATTVFNLVDTTPGDDSTATPVGAPYTINQKNTVDAQFYGIYAQDEWKISPRLTVNYGARFDIYESSTDHEYQVSPRVNAIYKISSATTVHAGYARYFTPPPLESVNSADIAAFTGPPGTDGTSNLPPGSSTQNDPVKAERSHYFDAGVSHQITPDWSAGVDGYYKIARNQLDDGFFGQSLVPSAFNYDRGEVYGVELTTNYSNGGLSTYANAAWSEARGKKITSAQFLFDPGDLAYIQNHYVFLDHDQTVTATGGVAYTWKNLNGATRVYLDAVFGSGLRKDETLPDGSTIPNGANVPKYWTFSVGAEREFRVGTGPRLKLRLDLVNLLDRVYQLRDGSGIGVNAAQYGMRFGVFGSLSCSM